MRWLLIVLLALVVPVAATAGVPDGFYESKPLTVRLAKVGLSPDATLYCSRTDDAWMDFAAMHNAPIAANGLTNMVTDEVYLAPGVCPVMERHLRGKKVNLRTLGRAIHTLVHEAMHVRGIVNERVADCRALRLLPTVSRVHFGMKNADKRRLLLASARSASTVRC